MKWWIWLSIISFYKSCYSVRRLSPNSLMVWKTLPFAQTHDASKPWISWMEFKSELWLDQLIVFMFQHRNHVIDGWSRRIMALYPCNIIDPWNCHSMSWYTNGLFDFIAAVQTAIYCWQNNHSRYSHIDIWRFDGWSWAYLFLCYDNDT